MVSVRIHMSIGLLGALLCACLLLPAQPPEQSSAQLNVSGQIVVAGHSTPYLIRHLPISSFPDLPTELAVLLNRRGCLIPQTYEAHHPENVIHASLERPGSSDWAVLCSERGTVSLLVCFSSAPASLLVLSPRRKPNGCKPTTRVAFLASTGASIPPRPSRFTLLRSACCIARRSSTTTPWLIRSSITAPSTTSI